MYMGGDVLTHEMLSGISTVGRGLRVKGEGEVLMWRSVGASMGYRGGWMNLCVKFNKKSYPQGVIFFSNIYSFMWLHRVLEAP